MTSKELKQILESPITKGAKGRFMSIEELEQIKCELEAWFVIKPNIRFEEHSRAWIYLNKIYKDDPSYSVVEKNLQKNTRSITTVTKEGNEVTVNIVEFEDE